MRRKALRTEWRRLRSRQIQQHYVRAILHAFENNITTVGRDIKVANIELMTESRQLSLRTRLHIDEPQILMSNLSSQEHNFPSSSEESHVSSSPRERQGMQQIWCAFRCSRLHRKCSSNIGSRVDNKAAVGSPRRIDRVLPDKSRWCGMAVNRHAKQMRNTVIVRG